MCTTRLQHVTSDHSFPAGTSDCLIRLLIINLHWSMWEAASPLPLVFKSVMMWVIGRWYVIHCHGWEEPLPLVCFNHKEPLHKDVGRISSQPELLVDCKTIKHVVITLHPLGAFYINTCNTSKPSMRLASLNIKNDVAYMETSRCRIQYVI